MATVGTVLQVLEAIAPHRYAFAFDKVGLQVGDTEAAVTRALVSLDRSLAAVDHAEAIGAQLLLSHHPLIFQPLASVEHGSHVGRTIRRLIRAEIAFVAAHTNWDSAKGGVNDALAAILGLHEVDPFGQAAEVDQVKLVFFTPKEAADRVIDAVSEAGAGQIGLYRRCAFMHEGSGTFLGMEGTNPTVGQAGRVEHVEEVRVEMVLRAGDRRRVEHALRAAHPYEEPACDFFHLASNREQPAGRVGSLPSPLSLADLSSDFDRRLRTRCWSWGEANRQVKRVAVVGGAADGEWRAAQEVGADVLLTGEVRQHNALEAVESGFALIAAGHYATEQPGVAALAARMGEAAPDVEWVIFEPDAGVGGRPL